MPAKQDSGDKGLLNDYVMDDKLLKQREAMDTAYLKAKNDSIMLKILAYLLALILGGAIVCLVMGIMKTAIDSLMIVGIILLVVAFIVVWIYHSTKMHIERKRYKKLIRSYEEKSPV